MKTALSSLKKDFPFHNTKTINNINNPMGITELHRLNYLGILH